MSSLSSSSSPADATGNGGMTSIGVVLVNGNAAQPEMSSASKTGNGEGGYLSEAEAAEVEEEAVLREEVEILEEDEQYHEFKSAVVFGKGSQFCISAVAQETDDVTLDADYIPESYNSPDEEEGQEKGGPVTPDSANDGDDHPEVNNKNGGETAQEVDFEDDDDDDIATSDLDEEEDALVKAEISANGALSDVSVPSVMKAEAKLRFPPLWRMRRQMEMCEAESYKSELDPDYLQPVEIDEEDEERIKDADSSSSEEEGDEFLSAEGDGGNNVSPESIADLLSEKIEDMVITEEYTQAKCSGDGSGPVVMEEAEVTFERVSIVEAIESFHEADYKEGEDPDYKPTTEEEEKADDSGSSSEEEEDDAVSASDVAGEEKMEEE